MQMTRHVQGLLIGLVVLTAGCGHVMTRDIGESTALFTRADRRVILSTPVDREPDSGRIRAKQVICAEPSPDIITAVQKSFGLGTDVAVNIPGQPSGQASVSLAKARAEAAAQLGERLATIQLLRDGLYRACEAYANGAFSEVTYAVLLSQYDDTMITLLMGEFAAGNFGRQLATLGGNAGSNTTPQTKQPTPPGAVQASAKAEPATAPTDVTKNKSALDAAPTASNTAPDNREKQTAATTATATAGTAGAITHTPSLEIAKTLHEMQRKYIENINADALVVACVTAMSHDKANTSLSGLSEICAGEKGILKQVLNGQQEQLRILKARTLLESIHPKPLAAEQAQTPEEQRKAQKAQEAQEAERGEWARLILKDFLGGHENNTAVRHQAVKPVRMP